MRGWFTSPWQARLLSRLGMVAAALLVATSIVLGFHSEAVYRTTKVEEAEMQVRILAATLSAALAFNDPRAAEDYVAAMGKNPRVMAAGAYDAGGVLVASYQAGAMPPDVAPSALGSHFDRDEIVVSAPVEEGSAVLGTAYLRIATEPLSLRLTRYGATALLVLVAAGLMALLGAAQGALARSNRLLEEQMAQREKAEKALRHAHKMEAIGQLTGGVAHDFNNLLQAIAGCLQMIWRRHPDPAIEPFVSAGRQAVDRGAKLTQQLLAFARRQSLRPEPLDLRQHLRNMSELLTRALRTNIRLEVDIPDGLWPVKADATQFELAVLNLVVNARDALGPDGLVRIEGRNRPGSPDLVEVTVRDTGSGMAPEVLARAFDPFFTTKEVGQGSGLGLSQVYGFAKQSGGTARIESSPGRGTAVTLLLPRSDRGAVPQDRPAPAVAAAGGGRILLVEDDPEVARTVEATLREIGYEVRRVADAAQALETTADWRAVDLLLTDIIMPGKLSGLDLAREARRRRPDLPVVLMTGYSGRLDTRGFRVLVKPYEAETLAQALSEEMRRGGTA